MMKVLASQLQQMTPSKSQLRANGASEVQSPILEQLKRVNTRLDDVEDRFAEVKLQSTRAGKISSLSLPQISTPIQDSDSSFVEFLVPSLNHLKSNRDIQQQVYSRMHELKKNVVFHKVTKS